MTLLAHQDLWLAILDKAKRCWFLWQSLLVSYPRNPLPEAILLHFSTPL